MPERASSTVVKICSICGLDLSAVKRVKDPAGNYYCRACWATLEQRASQAAPAQDGADSFPCHVCRRSFPIEQVYSEPDGKFICKSCWGNSASLTPVVNAPTVDGLEVPDDPFSADLTALAPLEPPPEPPPIAASEPVQKRKHDEFFCERCDQVFPPKQLTMGPDGAVLCKACLKRARQKAKLAQRSPMAMVQKAAEKAERPPAQGSVGQQAATLSIFLPGIACLLGVVSRVVNVLSVAVVLWTIIPWLIIGGLLCAGVALLFMLVAGPRGILVRALVGAAINAVLLLMLLALIRHARAVSGSRTTAGKSSFALVKDLDERPVGLRGNS